MTEMDNTPPEGVEQQTYQQPQQPVYPQQMYQQPYAVMTPEQSAARGMAIAGMVLGILSLVLCWVFWLGLPLGIVGLILSIIAMKRGDKGMAIAGLVCSIIGLAIGLLIIIIFIVTISTVTNTLYGL